MTHSVSVFGAAGYAGALSARLVDRHPALELRAITARGGDVGRRLVGPVSAPSSFAGARGARPRPSCRGRGCDRGVSARRCRRGRLRTARSRGAGRRSERRLPAADPAVYEEWYREHPNPELIAERVYGLPELYRQQLHEPAGRQPRLLPDRRDPVAGAAGARRPDRRRRDRRQVGRLWRRPWSDRQDPFRDRRREPEPVRRPAASAHAGNRAGAGSTRRRPDRSTFTPHLIPLDQGELVSCYVTLTPVGGP